MSTTASSKPAGEQAAATAPVFSYAQAAKGQAQSGRSTVQSSKAPSGTNTPKDSTAPAVAIPVIPSTISKEGATKASTTGPEELSNGIDHDLKGQSRSASSTRNGISHAPNSTSSPSSPTFGMSSVSTLPKEDDNSSNPNASATSDSTWDKQSQASGAAEKGNGDAKTKGTKGEDAEKAIPAPALNAAPVPSVNIWQQRREAAAARAKTTPKSAAPAVEATIENVKPVEKVAEQKVKPKVEEITQETLPASVERKKSVDAKALSRDEASKRTGQTKKNNDKENQQPISQSAPVVSDTTMWPTPDTVAEDKKKKQQQPQEKAEKITEDASSPVREKKGKKEWTTLDFTPTVVYNTPLPTSARRGGKASRGGREGTGRGSGESGRRERRLSTSSRPSDAPANGETQERGRDGPRARRTGSPPAKQRRPTSAGPRTGKDDRRISTTSDSPKQKDGEQQTGGEAEGVPEHLGHSRRASVATQTESSKPCQEGYQRSRAESGLNGHGGPERGRRNVPGPAGDNYSHARSSDARRQSEGFGRGSEYYRDGSHYSHERGEGKSERGRGGYRGSRGGANGFGHHASGPHPTLPQSAGPFTTSIPKSGSFNSQQPQQFNGFGMLPPPPRGYRNESRSRSIPNSAVFGRFPGPMSPGMPGGPMGLAPIQTHMPPMNEYQAMAMSAMPYNNFVDQFSLFSMVSMQLEYYFSVDNLCKDMFLRKHMDSQGFVPLSIIANFNRIKQLTEDLELLRYVCFQSPNIEIWTAMDGVDRLRKREGWQQWVLNMDERDPAAQNDGPSQIQNPRSPHPHEMHFQGLPPDMHPMSPTEFNRMDPIHGEGPMLPGLNGVPPPFGPFSPAPGPNGHMANGDSYMGEVPPFPGMLQEFGSQGAPLSRPLPPSQSPPTRQMENVFTDEQADSLMIVFRKQGSKDSPAPAPFHNTSSRSFSNGSIDPATMDRFEDLNLNSRSPAPNGSPKTELSPPTFHQRTSSHQSLLSPSKVPGGNPPPVFWVKNQDAPTETLPSDLMHESYNVFRFNALTKRGNTPKGECHHDMDILYQFWSHFLIRNFNVRMYEEFRDLAITDAKDRQTQVGMINLVQFYDQSLNNQKIIDEAIAQDYVNLVRSEDKSQQLGFKKLRSAWRNGALNMKNRKKIDNIIDADLKVELEK